MPMRRRALTSLADALGESIRDIRPAFDRSLTIIKLRWSTYVGQKLAEHVRPIDIHDTTLLLSATDASWQDAFDDVLENLMERLKKDCPQLEGYRWTKSSPRTIEPSDTKSDHSTVSDHENHSSRTLIEALERFEIATRSMRVGDRS